MDVSDEGEANNNNLKFSCLNKYSPLFNGGVNITDSNNTLRGGLNANDGCKAVMKNSPEVPSSPAGLFLTSDLHNLSRPSQAMQQVPPHVRSIGITSHGK